jgi:hypothetical protein
MVGQCHHRTQRITPLLTFLLAASVSLKPGETVTTRIPLGLTSFDKNASTLTTFGCPTQSALHNREHFIFIGPSPLLDSVSG